MNYHTRSFLISFLLHSLIIVLVISGSTFVRPYKKPITLDFDLSAPPSAVNKIDVPAPGPVKTMPVQPALRQVVREKEAFRLPAEVAEVPPDPEMTPVVKLPETTVQAKQPTEPGISKRTATAKEASFDITSAVKETPVVNSGAGNINGVKEAARIKYLNENFAYIRDKILRNVSYPDTARRMGWQGKVVLSFVIEASGSVREFKIVKSSGFTMLDNSAIETVKETAPFPGPPGEAQLVIPITYHLE